MRRVRIVLGLAAAVCAFGALTAPAFAAKKKLVFGHFAASIVGKPISESAPAKVVENKEDEAEINGLQLGQFTFGVLEKGKPNFGEPCEEAPKVSGKVTAEESPSLLTEVQFRRCISSIPHGGTVSWKASSFKLAINFIANKSAEVGNTQGGIKIEKNATVTVKGAGQCTIVIPRQFVPGKSAEKPEKFWEGAEYEDEEEEPENWEKSKKLKEQYPGGEQLRLKVETTEKFRGIVTYVDTATTKKTSGCDADGGEENGKLVTEKEIEVEGKMVENPYYHWLEYKNGQIELAAEGLEIKGGQLTFVEPPEEA